MADASGDLHVAHSRLLPDCLEAGRWPREDEWGLSDHGVVTSRFVRSMPPEEME